MIAVWGAAANAAVFDVTLRGNGAIRSGVVGRQPEGFRGMRVQARGFTDYGVLVDANEPTRQTLRRPFVLADIDVAGVARAVPRSSNGTAEACVWVGNPGVVRACASAAAPGRACGRARPRPGFASTESTSTTRPTGVYVEHFTRGAPSNGCGSARGTGRAAAEWASPAGAACRRASTT